MADGKVVLVPDSTGKAVDTAELTRADATVVERERVALADHDDVTITGLAKVSNRRLLVSDDTGFDVSKAILAELRAIRLILAAGLDQPSDEPLEELE